MRYFFLIILSLLSITGWSQKSMLRKADFAEEKLDESWVVVKVKPGTTLELSKEREVKILHATKSSEKSILDGLCKIKLANNQNPIDFCNELLKQENVIYAEPIVEEKPLYIPSDANSQNQYYLSTIKAFEAWDITRGDDDITIGIIDTGIDLDHEDLSSKLWTNTADPVDGIDNDENGYIDDFMGYDFADEDNDPNADLSGHGVEVAGIAGAGTDNGIGISSIGFNTKIAALKGFRSSNNSSGGLYEAIIYAADNGIEILNLSWGSTKNPLQFEQDIINYAVLEKDVVVVAAAGNDGNKLNPEAKFYPASYDNVLSIGATDAEDNKSSLSSYNHSMDLMAPGDAIYSTRLNNTYASGFGTSLSSPMVAGTAALVKDQFPTLNAQQIMERIRVSADDIYDIGNNASLEGKLGKGRLNMLRAVAETGLKSIRVSDISLSTNRSNQVFYGDTAIISGSYTNYLSRVNDPMITLSSETELSLEPIHRLGSMQTLQEKDFSYQIIIPEEIAPSSEIIIRVDLVDGSYSDFQFIEFETAPDYFDFGNENLTMTISGTGNWGYADQSFNNGIGFQSELGPSMKYAGFLIATSKTSLSDNIVTFYDTDSRSNDFSRNKDYKIYHHPSVDFYGYSEFKDVAHGLVIEQSNLAWSDRNFMVMKYRVINNSTDPINNVLIGSYTDWDNDDALTNKASYNSENNYSLVSNNTENQFAATQIIGSGVKHHSNLDIGSRNGNEADVTNMFFDQGKYEFLTINQFDSAGTEGSGNDVASLNGVMIEEILPSESVDVSIILAVGTSTEEIESTLTTAQTFLQTFKENPLVLETFKICDLNQIVIDPSNGVNYEFYSDPLGENLLASGSSFEPTDITSDTTFYVRNIDDLYASDFFQIKLSLFTDIANFKLSTDTLYLDNSTNVVSFTDTSLDAVSWAWDFGQGTSVSIQHPSISFNEEGIYSISLTVTNEIGCEDTIVKNLVVANRPSAPTFQDYQICPTETITLNDPEADKLKVYSSLNDQNPLLGQHVEVGPFTENSTIYVSGIYDGFESEQVPVGISIHNAQADFIVVPDTSSTEHRLQFLADIDEQSTIQWQIDDIDFGSDSIITITAVEGSLEVRLNVATVEGCSLSITKNIQINSSPIPIQGNVSKCDNEVTFIQPENGIYFGFYHDEELTSLIKKGTQLEVSDAGTVYVVGLDDGLPSQPIEVRVENIPFSATIDYTTEKIASKNKVSFNAISDSLISQYEWFVNGELAEIVASPSLFFDNEEYEVVLFATSSAGCLAMDTITLDFTEVVLGSASKNDFKIYPNPSNDFIHFETHNLVESISIHNMAGQLLYKVEHPTQRIDIRTLTVGLYIMKLSAGDELLELNFIKN